MWSLRMQDRKVVRLELSEAMDGLVLDIPEGWTLDETRPGRPWARQHGNSVVLGPIQGSVSLNFKSGMPLNH